MEIIGSRGEIMKDKLGRLLKENGFLIFLFACVCIVAASTIFMVIQDTGGSKEDQNLRLIDERSDDIDDVLEVEEIQQELIDEDDSDDIREDNKESQNQSNEARETFADNDEIPEDDEPQFIEEDERIEQNPNQALVLPVDGEIITEFTTDTLVYSETLDEWRGHSGIDIKGDKGSMVKAALDGKVKEIYEDPLWGNVIILDHGNDLLTKYANLGTKDMVKVGLEVKQGDEIGIIGKTADIEMLMESHLHFEVIKDGKVIDPRSIQG